MALNPVYPTGYEDGTGFNPGQLDYTQPDFTMPPVTVTGQRDPTSSGIPDGWPPGFDPSGGGGSLFSGITDPFTGGGGGGGGGSDFYNRAALFGSALNDWYSSNQYMDMATKYAGQMNPFGSQRGYYQDLLKKSYEDPTAVLNDPAHKAIQERQMAALSAKMGASGYMGSGLEKTQLADYLATSDNQFLADYQNRLMTPAGANIGPAAAAGLIQTGIKGSIDARNNALANAARAFNPATGPSTVINNNNGGQGGAGPNGGNGSTKPMDLSWLKQTYPNATIAGKDQYGNTVLSAGGKMIGYLGSDGKTFTPYTPGMSGETDTSGDNVITGGPPALDLTDINQLYAQGFDPNSANFDIGSLGLFDP